MEVGEMSDREAVEGILAENPSLLSYWKSQENKDDQMKSFIRIGEKFLSSPSR